ncbi:MAG: DUF423 domain-containing protein [Verrucomicrobiota bacterium]
MNRFTGISGCVAALLAVALGAFGAHALKDALLETGKTEVWRTAVDYQMWHSLALLLIASLGSGGWLMRASSILFLVGIVFFSGSLYWLALDGPNWLGPITPIGGLAFIVGWLLLAIGFIKTKSKQT